MFRARAKSAYRSWSRLSNTACKRVFLCLGMMFFFPCLRQCLMLCLWSHVFCSCRSEGGFCHSPWVCSSGWRAGAWRAAFPRDLHNGAAAPRHRLSRPRCTEPCVPQPAWRSARQPPQRHIALWAGQADHFYLFPYLSSHFRSRALIGITDSCLWSSQGGVRTILSGFHNILSQTDPSFTGLLFFWFIFALSCPVGCYSCVTSSGKKVFLFSSLSSSDFPPCCWHFGPGGLNVIYGVNNFSVSWEKLSFTWADFFAWDLLVCYLSNFIVISWNVSTSWNDATFPLLIHEYF